MRKKWLKVALMPAVAVNCGLCFAINVSKGGPAGIAFLASLLGTVILLCLVELAE